VMTNTDDQLLAAAAKAYGYSVTYDASTNEYYENVGYHTPWNPLEDDGDAARLGADLEIDIQHNWESVVSIVAVDKDGTREIKSFKASIIDDDRRAAVRRAIVIAAGACVEG
jgi:hypothetical protein